MDVKQILSQMTLEEKAALCQGADTWHTVTNERLGVPAMACASRMIRATTWASMNPSRLSVFQLQLDLPAPLTGL